MPSQATAQKYLSTAQAAERWGVHPETIKRLIRDGSLPAYRLKRILRIDVNDLDSCFRPTRGR